MQKYTLTDCVFLTLQNAFTKQKWVTFQDIQDAIDKELEKVAQFDDKLQMIVKYFEKTNKEDDTKKETKSTK